MEFPIAVSIGLVLVFIGIFAVGAVFVKKGKMTW